MRSPASNYHRLFVNTAFMCWKIIPTPNNFFINRFLWMCLQSSVYQKNCIQYMPCFCVSSLTTKPTFRQFTNTSSPLVTLHKTTCAVVTTEQHCCLKDYSMSRSVEFVSPRGFSKSVNWSETFQVTAQSS